MSAGPSIPVVARLARSGAYLAQVPAQVPRLELAMCPLVEVEIMPTYVALLSWTDQGIRNYKDTAKRAESFASAVQKLGAKLLSIYWTVGPYDLVASVEAPDDETGAAALLQLDGVGNVRSTTLRAFGTEEMEHIIAKAAG